MNPPTQYDDPLLRADSAAVHLGEREVDGTTLPCSTEPRYALEVRVLGEDDRPLSGIAVELAQPGTGVLRELSNNDGIARFEKLAVGGYDASLYELDQDAWQPLAQEALAQPASSGNAAWHPAPASERQPLEHTVAPSDCIALLAERHGFAPATLWDWPANAALKAARTSMYVLYDGADGGTPDRVAIPVPRRKTMLVSTGQRHTVRRIGVPEMLDVTFQQNTIPIANVRYLLSVLDADGIPLFDRAGSTDKDGRLKESIPPHAAGAEVTLVIDSDARLYRFALGHLDPVDTLPGLRSMLTNLGYPCEHERGTLGPVTQAAVEAFRCANDMQEGGLDDAVRARLREVYGK